MSDSLEDSAVRGLLQKRLAEVNLRIASACARAKRNPDSVRMVAVTKTATPQQIREMVSLGVRDLGENRVQVLASHIAAVGDLAGVRWHMIGHVQRNKVRDLLPRVEMIQSVDSLRLAQEIETQAGKLDRRMPVLIEINAGEESQKSGADIREAGELAGRIAAMPHLELHGLMSMAPLTGDVSRIRGTFARTRQTFQQIRAGGLVPEAFRELSMGMSGDFEIAIEEGATIVRIGSLLFA